MKNTIRLLCLFALALGCYGQNVLVYNPFTRKLDYNGPFLPPNTTAAITASNCTLGQMAFATDATAGHNLYECTATNTWTQSASGGAATAGGTSSTLQWNNATVLGGISQWTTNGSTTITGSATAILDLSATTATNIKFPAGYFQVNGSNLINQVPVNFQAAGTPASLTLTASNSSSGIVLYTLAGGANIVLNNTPNTGTSSMTLNMLASTSTNALIVPGQAGLTASTSGAIGEDTTTAMYHNLTGGVDSIFAAFATSASIANNDCVKWVVSGSTKTIASNGGSCAGSPSNAFYLVNQSTNAPVNAINLGALSTGVLFGTVSGGVSTIGTATISTGLNLTGSTLTVDESRETSQITAQASTPWKCTDAGASGHVFTCNMVPAPAAYVDKQLVIFTPNTSCDGTNPTTLNIQGLGAINIYKVDGASVPIANDCLAGQPTILLFNQSLNSGAGGFQISSLLGTSLPVTVACNGDGATDVTSCIQTFVTNNDYIVFPEPTVAYLTTAPITLHANLRIEGASPTTNTKGITNNNNTSDVFQCVSAANACRNISIKDMMFRDTAPARTAGDAIHIDGQGSAATLDIENNMALGFFNGYRFGGLLNSLIYKNRSTNALQDSFHEDAATQTSTGTSFISNYCDHPARDGYNINGLNYSGFYDNSCDSAGRDAYHLDASVTPIRGVVLIGNGSEQAVGHAMYVDGQGILIDGGALTTASSGAGKSAIFLNGAINTRIGSNIFINGNWDYCINQARSPLHDTFMQQWTNTISYPLTKCAGVTLGYMNDSGGITGGSFTMETQTRAVKVVCSTALPFTPTYNNAAGLPGGFGATLTAAGVGILSCDGYNTVLNDRVLVAGQASAFQNGPYCVSTQGTAGAAYVLTRCPDATIPAQLSFAGPISVLSGASFTGTAWQLTSLASITVGTTNLIYNQITNGYRSTQTISGADYTNTSVTPSTVFSWTLPATQQAVSYAYKCSMLWESTAATLVGPVFGLNISAAPTQLTGSVQVSTAVAGTYTTGYLSNATTGSQTLITSAAAAVTSTNYPATIWGTIEGAPVAGSTFIINAAATSGTTANLNIRRGGSCELFQTP